ncbi:Protein of unknown function [Propionibacterium freudenreichii]|jgi:TnpA family transposase
MLLG